MRRSALLKILAGIAVAAFLAATSAEAERPAPEMRCKGTYGPYIRCEAKYVWPFIPEWSAGDQKYGKGYGDGFGMTMKVGDDWTLIEMVVADRVLQAEVRRHENKIEFRAASRTASCIPSCPGLEQIAEKPP